MLLLTKSFIRLLYIFCDFSLTMWMECVAVVVVVVELPQTPEDDVRSARAARGRRMS